jgi:hypothetical protein
LTLNIFHSKHHLQSATLGLVLSAWDVHTLLIVNEEIYMPPKKATTAAVPPVPPTPATPPVPATELTPATPPVPATELTPATPPVPATESVEPEQTAVESNTVTVIHKKSKKKFLVSRDYYERNRSVLDLA